MLLARQLQKLGLARESPPDADGWRRFLERVQRTYVQADQDRYTVERSLMVVSGEMQQLYDGLRRSEANFKTLVESSPDAIFVRGEHVIRYANPAMVRLLGFEDAYSLIGRRTTDLFVHPDDRDLVMAYRAHVADGGPGDLRVRWIRSDGTVLVVQGISASITYDGEPAVVTIARDVTERLLAEKEREAAETSLRASEERYRALFEGSPLSIMLFDPESLQVLGVNEAAIALYGYARHEFLALRVSDLKVEAEDPDLREVTERTLHSPVEARGWPAWNGTKPHRRKDGTVLEVAITSHTIAVDGRLAILATGIDVTDRRRLEEQLLHVQKMDAVGLLAGGVAHDFNNLMSVVLSYSHMLIESGLLDDRSKADLVEVRLAGERASKLTQQLLIFSRKQRVLPEVVDLNEVVLSMGKMLRPLLGDNIEIARSVIAKGKVYADPSQLELVIMNLVVNARDAMGGHGNVAIATRDVVLAPGPDIEVQGAMPGPYVKLSVSDTGVGMNAETRGRIFEPFFTTKERGHGTGLGLSTVFGIVKQCGGYIAVESAPARGTSFHIYLPSCGEKIEAHRSSLPSPTALRGSETVLVVEDNEQVRHSFCAMLSRSGYRVIEAQNAGEAFLIFEQDSAKIDVVLTDVMMPRMSGPQLVKRLLGIRPDIKVLYVSGYAEDVVARECAVGPAVAFLTKPVTPHVLARKLRELLDIALESPGEEMTSVSLTTDGE